MAFQALVMRKQGTSDRVAASPAEQVSLEFQGFVVHREASKAVSNAVGSGAHELVPSGTANPHAPAGD